MEINKIYCESNVVTLSKMDDEFIDMVITSPPYDDARSYNGHINFNLGELTNELYRTVKYGGVVVWVVADRTIRGTETCSSFNHVMSFRNSGFNLHDTMIYLKNGVGASGSKWCYNQSFEYMFVFTKGKIKTFNPIKDLIPKRKNGTYSNGRRMSSNGTNERRVYKKAPKASKRTNVWQYDVGFINGDDKTSHPAPFPEQLAEDHILSWSNKGDLVYDPFMGSGTTAKMCKKNGRNYIGSEISREYCDIAEMRLM